MVEISEIRDGDSLEAWLVGKPREFAVTVAARCALRALPIYWSWSLTEAAHERNLTALPILRCNLVAVVACNFPNAAVEDVAANADVVAVTTYAANATAARAAAASANANAAAVRTKASNAHINVASYASNANAALASEDYAWVNIQLDCMDLQKERDLFKLPIWRGKNPFSDLWADVRSKAAGDHNWQSGDWGFWVDWYDQMLDPVNNPPNWELLKQVALISSGVWEQGPVAVGAESAKLEQLLTLREEAMTWQERAEALEAQLASLKQRSHNKPPELIGEAAELLPLASVLNSNLATVSEELAKPEPDVSVLRKCGEAIKAAAIAIAAYCGSVANDVIRAGTKPFGVAGGTFLADKAFNDGRLLEYATKLINFAAGG